MFVLYSSNILGTYTTASLEALAYPHGHRERSRYAERLVAPSVQNLLKTDSAYRPKRAQAEMLYVYAQGFRKSPQCDVLPNQDHQVPDKGRLFAFYPIRFGRVLQIERIGSVYFIDYELGTYVDYGATTDCSIDQMRSILAGSGRKFPLPEYEIGDSKALEWPDEAADGPVETDTNPRHSGHFLDRIEVEDSNAIRSLTTFKSTVDREREAWESVIDHLASQECDLRGCLFYRVSRVLIPRAWPIRLIPRYRLREMNFSHRHVRHELVIPAGTLAVLPFETYRPEPPLPLQVSISATGEGIAGVEPSEFRFDTRYNKKDIILGTNRVLGDVMSRVVIKVSRDAPLYECLKTRLPPDPIRDTGPGMHPYPVNDVLPVLEFPLRLSLGTPIVLLAFLSLVAGLVLLSMSAADWMAINSLAVEAGMLSSSTPVPFTTVQPIHAALALIGKISGAALPTLVAFILFRRTKLT